MAVAAAERAREAGSDVKWYYMAGDDTFVDVPKLSKFLGETNGVVWRGGR